MSREKIEEMAEIEKAAEWFENRAKTTPMQGARRMFELAGEALREKANGVTVQKWISVEERLPDNGNAVLVNRYNKSLKFSVANIDNYQGYGKWWDKDYNGEVWTITHWMPLPEAPKMKGGGEG